MQKIAYWWWKRKWQRRLRASASLEGAEWIGEYQRAFAPEHYRRTLQETSYVVLDTETTGLSPKKDRLLSISALRISQQTIRMDDTFEVIVKPDLIPDHKAIPVHQLLSADLRHGVPLPQALADFVHFAGNDILVAHHASFDRQMLNRALRQHFGLQLYNPWIDTARLAQRLLHQKLFTDPAQAASLSLDRLCERFHIPLEHRHHAAGDTLATGLLLLRLLHLAQQKKIRRAGQLMTYP